MEKDTEIVPMRIGNAKHWGVRLPDFWRTCLRCRHLLQHADLAATMVSQAIGRRRAGCWVAGVPKRHDGLSLNLQRSDATDLRPGAVVPFEEITGRVDYIVCANISGSKWFCHSGTFSGSVGCVPCGVIEAGDLDVSGLVVKDLAAHAWVAETSMKTRSAVRRLQKLVRDSPDSWDRLVAVSAFLAERKAAEENRRAINFGIAVASFEPDPWQWKVPERWMSHTDVYFLWNWTGNDGRWCNELLNIRLDSVLSRFEVPWPTSLRNYHSSHLESQLRRVRKSHQARQHEAAADIDRFLQSQRSGRRACQSKRSKDLCGFTPMSP